MVIHEMIHYFIVYNGLHDSSSHGRIFRSIMDSINSNYSRNITITNKIENDKYSGKTRLKERIIAVVKMKNGKTGIKVLPKKSEKIVYYYRTMLNSVEVETITLYQSFNPFFSRYPTSSALHVYHIDEETLNAHISDSVEIRI